MDALIFVGPGSSLVERCAIFPWLRATKARYIKRHAPFANGAAVPCAIFRSRESRARPVTRTTMSPYFANGANRVVHVCICVCIRGKCEAHALHALAAQQRARILSACPAKRVLFENSAVQRQSLSSRAQVASGSFALKKRERQTSLSQFAHSSSLISRGT